MLNKIALIAALTTLAVGCGKKKSNSSPSVQPPVTQQPITEPVTPAPTYDQSQNLTAQAVGLYQQSDNPNVYFRIDNQLNVETTLQLPVRTEGSDNRLTPTFPQILRVAGANQLETLGYVNRGGNTFDNVTLRVTPINNGQIIDVTMVVKLRQGDTVVSTGATTYALNDLSDDETHHAFSRNCGKRRCNRGCGGGGIVLPFPIPLPGMPGGGYTGAPYPGYPGYPANPSYPGYPGYPADGGTYPIPPSTNPGTGTNCPDGNCVGQPLEDKEFVYRFVRIG